MVDGWAKKKEASIKEVGLEKNEKRTSKIKVRENQWLLHTQRDFLVKTQYCPYCHRSDASDVLSRIWNSGSLRKQATGALYISTYLYLGKENSKGEMKIRGGKQLQPTLATKYRFSVNFSVFNSKIGISDSIHPVEKGKTTPE